MKSPLVKRRLSWPSACRAAEVAVLASAFLGCTGAGESTEHVARTSQAVETMPVVAPPPQTKAPPPPATTPPTKAIGQQSVWVLMKDKPNLASATSTKDWKERGRAVYSTLTATAKASQSDLRSFLTGRGIAHKSFWGVNAIKVTADKDAIADIYQRPDVARVVQDRIYQIPPVKPGEVLQRIQAVEWNIQNIRASEAWAAFGSRGEGIVVASIDTGVAYDHPALVQKYRGLNADGTFDHNYNWYDPANICGSPSLVPCDNVFHGTHTMGTMVGDDGGENQIGVAPGARWIAAKGCEYSGCSLESLVSSGQWVLAPTDLNGQNPSPDLRPHVVNNSWGGGGGDDFYREIVQSWVAAGIFPVFAVGNSGPSCGSAGSPGDYNESYSVGAYDANNVIADFSSRGPSYFDGSIKPDIAAPGVAVRSSVPGGSYEAYDGASMSAPHVAGTVALLWAASPAVMGNIEATRALLDDAAIDQDDQSCGGTADDNNVWGEGKLDAYATLNAADIGPVGTLIGIVASTDGTLIQRAVVTATGPSSRRTFTNAAGAYSVRLPVGTYAVNASAFGYYASEAPAVAVSENTTTTQDFVLSPAPSFRVSGTVLDDDGLRVANASVAIVGTPLPAVVTDESGYYEFPSVPAGEYSITVDAGGCYVSRSSTLTVDSNETLNFDIPALYDGYGYRCHSASFDYIEGDTPVSLQGDDELVNISLPFSFLFYGQSYDRVSVTTNGYLAFDTDYAYYYNYPIPTPSNPNAAVFALWDDLYVDGSSAVSTRTLGTAPHRQFVVEWRDVQFLASNGGERVSFEIVLYEDGKILTQYLTAGSTPLGSGSSATVGIENAYGDMGLQYSYNQPALRAESAIVYEVPFAGIVQGIVTDGNDGLPVAGATVNATGNPNGPRTVTTNKQGVYRMQLTQDFYALEASKLRYQPSTAYVTVIENQTLQQDFKLATPKGTVAPTTLELLVPVGASRERHFNLSSQGTLPLEFDIRETGGSRQTVATTAKLARNPLADPSALSTKSLFEKTPPKLITPMAAGDVLTSFAPLGLQLAWGVGEIPGANLWLSDPVVTPSQNHEFTSAGQATGTIWSASWAGDWAADMAYDSSRNLMCQIAVGMPGGIYCWDAATGEVVQSITGSFPWTQTSQRGLAYRPDDDTFYVGGWNDETIYHIKGLGHADKGAVISSCRPADGSISGLAWNYSMNVLWVATNSETDTIYELNADDCTVLSKLSPPQGGGYQGAGLEMDSEGNLWAIAQSPNTVFLIDSGVPAFSDIPWLSVEPTTGTVIPGGQQSLRVTVNTTGLEPGLYLGAVYIKTNAGREPTLRVPVSLIVSAYQQGVNAGGPDYTDALQDPWAQDRAYSSGSWGYVQNGRVKRTSHDIADTLDPALYQNQRANPYAYRFDNVPNGVYAIELRFAELENISFGERLFDVILENDLVLPAYDIAYEVGQYTADDHRFFIEVTDQRMDIRLVPREGYRAPVINALRITHRSDR